MSLARAAHSRATGRRAEELVQIIEHLERASQRPPSDLGLDDDDWKGPKTLDDKLEKVMGSQPTFLPISFFEVGLIRAKSVVRVVVSKGHEKWLGTGFLTKGNVIITNNHVISDEDTARNAVIQFNYQLTSAGLPIRAEEFSLMPDQGFATSPANGGDDWTAVRSQPNLNEHWGSIDIEDISIKVEEFLYIIQHPGGLYKQIALYHNIATYSDSRRVQYLSDTLPGSSGSPVFDSQWRLVAVHHSGGWLNQPGSKKVLFRNEGISVGTLLKGLKSHGLY